ncbi:glycoside hydrolase superfamily [Aspergillus carlsbadensis]|nr:glycoside hydrolase superfamily [Aspergillus carlsbadensis]
MPTTGYTTITTESRYGLNAYGVSIRWQSSDFATSTSISTDTTPPSASSTSGSSPSETPEGSQSQSLGLSTGAKAGIGVGSAVAGLLLILIGLLIYLGSCSARGLLDADQIIKSWSHLTLGLDREATNVIQYIVHTSWPAYQNYTSGNIGLPSLTDVTNTHFGPNVRAGDDNEYGIWTRSDSFSIGMGRTVRNGSGFAGQYPPEYGAQFEDIDTIPVEFLLWYHHVNYTHALPSGDIVIQHLYNAHYSGTETAQTFPARWKKLSGKLDRQQYKEILAQLTFQAGHAIVWQDSIVDYYHTLTGILDEPGRAGNHPLRIEGEDMQLSGYTVIELDPVESASGGFAVAALENRTLPAAEVELDRVSGGVWDVVVVYFDVVGGVAEWEVYLDDRLLGRRLGNHEYVFGHAGIDAPDGGSKMRIVFEEVGIRRGDVLRLEGVLDGLDAAVLDYVAVIPVGTSD